VSNADLPETSGTSVGCGEVLAQVYLYLDLECSNGRRETIREHLDECSPCLREYGIEQEVKELVARCCGAETAPAELRERLRRKLAGLVSDESRMLQRD
jgi:mycothiol system anti-sigma-R factor